MVKAHAERRKVGVLFVAQVDDREVAHGLEVTRVAAGRDRRAVARGDRLLREEIARDVDDVVAAVARFRKLHRLAQQFARARLHRQREVGDLHAGVVVIELARHLPALRREQVGERIAERGLARVAKVQRPGRVGRNKLDHHAVAGMRGRRAEALALAQRQTHDLLLGRGRQPQVDEARPGDLHRIDEAGGGRVDLQRIGDGLADLARVLLQRLRDLHRDVAGEVAVRLDLRPLQHDWHAGDAEAGKRLLDQRGNALFLLRKHWRPGGERGANSTGALAAAESAR